MRRARESICADDGRAGAEGGQLAVIKRRKYSGYRPDDVSDITVTAGATEALYARLPRWCGQGMRLKVCFPIQLSTAMPRPWRAFPGGVLNA